MTPEQFKYIAEGQNMFATFIGIVLILVGIAFIALGIHSMIVLRIDL